VGRRVSSWEPPSDSADITAARASPDVLALLDAVKNWAIIRCNSDRFSRTGRIAEESTLAVRGKNDARNDCPSEQTPDRSGATISQQMTPREA
jgi:hypothetical protein